MWVVSLLGVVLSVSVVTVQGGEMKSGRQEQRIPTTLSEAHAELERMLSPEELAKIDAMPSERDMIQYHMSLGLRIRNGWGLWTGGPLAKYMQELGITHPDHMSGVILRSFWCKRHGKDFHLEEEAAAARRSMDATQKRQQEEHERVHEAKAAMRMMMMGLRFEKRDVPIVQIPNRGGSGVRARMLSPFRDGVFISAYTIHLPARTGLGVFVTPGYYFDPADRKIHRIRVEEVNDVYSAVVIGKEAWFVGKTDGKAILVGVDDEHHTTQSLPQDGEPPQLGIDSESLLAVYPRAIFRLTAREWIPVYSGDITLPRSGLPPERHGDMVFFRDEGRGENCKRLWWLTLGEQPQLSTLDEDTRLVGPEGPRWENSFSYCVTKGSDLWACVGEGYSRTSLLRRSKDGSYLIAIMNNSVGFTEDLFGSDKTDQGLSVSAVTVLPDNTLLLVGDAGLYRLKGNELVQELAFTNSRQEVVDSNGRVVLHWGWNPSNVLMLNDGSYFISGAFGGIYLLGKGDDDQWNFTSLDEELGDPVVW